MMNTPYEVPCIKKERVSIIAIGDTLEAMTLRSVLEYFNYRVDLHWVGSRKEVLEILHGNIETFQYLILSCHGDGQGGILVPNESTITINDLAVSLPERIIINLGCGTGIADIALRFVNGGCLSYIAPSDFIESNSALLFVIHLFYELGMNHPIGMSFEKAQAFDKECGLFQMWE